MLRVFDRLGITEQMEAKTKAHACQYWLCRRARGAWRGRNGRATNARADSRSWCQGYAPATRIPAYHRVLGRCVGGINGAGRRKRIAEFPDVAGSGGGAYSTRTKTRVEERPEIRFVNDAEEPKNDPDHSLASSRRTILAPSTIAHIFPKAMSRGRYFSPQSGAT